MLTHFDKIYVSSLKQLHKESINNEIQERYGAVLREMKLIRFHFHLDCFRPVNVQYCAVGVQYSQDCVK